MTTPELPPLNRMAEGSGWVHEASVEARERILLARIAELEAEANRAWTRANHAESKVAAWERTMVVVGLPTRIEPGCGWGPGGNDLVEVPSLTPEKLTSILDRLARAEAAIDAARKGEQP